MTYTILNRGNGSATQMYFDNEHQLQRWLDTNKTFEKENRMVDDFMICIEDESELRGGLKFAFYAAKNAPIIVRQNIRIRRLNQRILAI